MTSRRALSRGCAAFGAAALVVTAGAGAAEAKTTVCDSYSSSCTPTHVKGVKDVRSPHTSVHGSTLPFTGGEIALMAVAGAGALAAGTMFVAAGRRRSQSA
jgi:hypothetical protein